MRLRRALPFLIAIATIPVAGRASAQSLGAGTDAFRPEVPVSAFARPAAWLDPSRMHLSAEFMVGTGFGGKTSGLQITRLQYQLADPLAIRVSLGNAMGPGLNSGSFFLESFDLSYQPFRSMNVQIRYQDVRSPLQLSRSDSFWR